MTMAVVLATVGPNLPPWLVALGVLVGLIVFAPQEFKTPTNRRVLVGVLVAFALAGVAHAADVIDLCPQYVGTIWWYLWGCYL